MSSGSSIARRPVTQKSNIELTSGLRANFGAAQYAARHRRVGSTGTNGAAESPHSHKPRYDEWTVQKDNVLFIPEVHWERSALSEEKESYEITVKLFFLPKVPSSHRCAQAKEAIDLVLGELHVSSIDLLIISFPGMSFDAESGQIDDEDAQETETSPEDVDSMIETWRCFEEMHDRKIVSKLGVAEFGAERLAAFLQRARVRPEVDQINVKDCCIVPKSLILFAKEQRVELLTHNDCTDILPQGITRELLGHGDRGAGVLASSSAENGLPGDVAPQWVAKYTAVVKNRGVIENKGYFAMAELESLTV